jgi:hypothetical protein
MDPIMIATVISSITEALKFALDGAQLISDGKDMTPEQVQERWTAMNDRYSASRKGWDDAGALPTETA